MAAGGERRRADRSEDVTLPFFPDVLPKGDKVEVVCVLFWPVSPENRLAEQKTNVFWITFHNEETLSGYTTAAEPGWICCGSISHISIGVGLGDCDERTAPLCSKGSTNESRVLMNSDILYLFSNTILALESEDESCRDLFGTNVPNYLFPFFSLTSRVSRLHFFHSCCLLVLSLLPLVDTAWQLLCLSLVVFITFVLWWSIR